MNDRIFAVIDKYHWMLATLLICNSAALEALPIVLNQICSEAVAIGVSVFGVLLFGEIIPMATCTGPQQVKIAYHMCPIVLFLMWATWPLSYPIGLLLDYVLGHQKIQRYDNDALKKLVLLHSQKALLSLEEHLPEGIQGLSDL